MRVRREYLVLAAVVVVCLLHSHLAFAAGAAGGLPWDNKITQLQQEFTGPIPFIIGVIATLGSLGTLVLARNELSALLSAMLIIVLIVSILVNIVNFMQWVGGTGALI